MKYTIGFILICAFQFLMAPPEAMAGDVYDQSKTKDSVVVQSICKVGYVFIMAVSDTGHVSIVQLMVDGSYNNSPNDPVKCKQANAHKPRGKL